MKLPKIPPYLAKGDTIGIICPAGYMAEENVQSCITALTDWGYNVRSGHTVGGDSDNYFSGTDDVRLADLQAMLDDDQIKAILCARGGYGVSRIIDRVNFKRFKKNPKWIIGFSDITVLHSHIHTNLGIATIHGPMAAAFNDTVPAEDPYLNSLRNVLAGRKIKYKINSHPDNRQGEVVGKLVGGNLALLAHACGSASDIETRGKILFLEDIGEYLYNIDRMLYQLKRSGKFDRLGGLIIGGFSDLNDTIRPFGDDVYGIFRDILKDYSFPVCYDFPVSHSRENLALKVGIGYKLKVGKSKVTLEE